MKSILFLSALFTVTFFIGCNKEPGEGGTSSITGKVFVVNLDNSGDTVNTYYGMDKDVYVIYGEDSQTYSDKFSTSLDGSFAFHHLTPGKYTVFAYSKCNTCPGEQDVVKQTIEITEKKQELVIEDLVILD